MQVLNVVTKLPKYTLMEKMVNRKDEMLWALDLNCGIMTVQRKTYARKCHKKQDNSFQFIIKHGF